MATPQMGGKPEPVSLLLQMSLLESGLKHHTVISAGPRDMGTVLQHKFPEVTRGYLESGLSYQVTLVTNL